MGTGQEEKWYLRLHGEAVGPFPSFQIARYLLLQRLHQDDELSRDKVKWFPIRDIPEVWPDKRSSAPGVSEAEKQRLQATRRWVDEHATLFVPLDEMRGAEEELLFEDEVYHPRLPESPPVHRLVGYGLALLLALAVITVPFLLPEGQMVDVPQCDAPAAPEVNWNNCRMEGTRLENSDLHRSRMRNADLSAAVLRAANLADSDLAYANLSQANLRGANLSGAMLTGASLRKSDLRSANLAKADLSYADLSGARLTGAKLDGALLGNAIIDEQTICMPESVGRCIPARR